MLPGNYFYAEQIKRQEFEREVRQRALVRVALASRDNRNFYSRDWLVHLGGWMIRWGESLESRYSAYNENSIPAHSTAKVH